MRAAPRARTLSRLPIRIRLTLAFAGVIAVVFGVAGVFLAREFSRDLDRSIDQAQRVQAEDVVALVTGARGPPAVAESGEPYAQVYASDGRVLGTTEAARDVVLLTPSEVRRATERGLRVKRRTAADTDLRVHAVAVSLPTGARAVVAVGDSLRRRDESVASLNRLLLIALPIALLLASFAGYEVAGAALRPVERMRRRAAEISDRNPSQRLPQPTANDEIGALGSTLNGMLDRLEEGLARERRLVSDASHELRTPLTTLRAELELALRGERDAATLREAIASADQEARRMTRIANDLLVLARADQGRLPLEPRPLVAGDLLTEAAERARAAAAADGRSVLVASDSASDAVVPADPDRLAQALDNLIGNSLRHGAGDIELRAERNGKAIELHVLDRGSGFDAEFLQRAFERFSRDRASSAAGAGLGLAIVTAIANLHGGGTGARNRAGGGADVWLWLPETTADAGGVL